MNKALNSIILGGLLTFSSFGSECPEYTESLNVLIKNNNILKESQKDLNIIGGVQTVILKYLKSFENINDYLTDLGLNDFETEDKINTLKEMYKSVEELGEKYLTSRKTFQDLDKSGGSFLRLEQKLCKDENLSEEDKVFHDKYKSDLYNLDKTEFDIIDTYESILDIYTFAKNNLIEPIGYNLAYNFPKIGNLAVIDKSSLLTKLDIEILSKFYKQFEKLTKNKIPDNQDSLEDGLLKKLESDLELAAVTEYQLQAEFQKKINNRFYGKRKINQFGIELISDEEQKELNQIDQVDIMYDLGFSENNPWLRSFNRTREMDSLLKVYELAWDSNKEGLLRLQKQNKSSY